MPKTVSSNCTPAILEWARKSAGFTLEAAERASGFHQLTLEEWEQGIELPTYVQLEKLAKLYHRPTMVFYLPEPPKDFTVVRDLRSVREEDSVPLSPLAIRALHQAQYRQSWARDQLTDEGAEPLPFVASLTIETGHTAAAAKIREVLKVTLQDQLDCASHEAAYLMWRRSVEAAGIFVFQFSRVDPAEVRGFALADDLSPCVAVNQKDQVAPRIFTLLHEVTHVFLGLSGVSDLQGVAKNTIERFCERTAAEILMPLQHFKSIAGRPTRETILHLSRVYKVSQTAITFRYSDAEIIPFEEAMRLAKLYQTRTRKEDEKREVKIPQARLALSRNGGAFTQMALNVFGAGDLSGGDLASLLSMKLNHLHNLEEMLRTDRR